MRARLRRDPHVAVCWALRATEFGGFLSNEASHTSCGGQRLTAVGGDDLTNAVITAQKVTLGRPWLRLYHAAHAAPLEGGGLTARFSALYESRYGQHDPWRDDGHPAIAWDASMVLSSAVNQSYQDTGDGDFGRDTVLAELRRGVGGPRGIQGVTGALDFSGGAEVPPDKPVMIRYATGRAERTALECGIRTPGGTPGRWGPHDRFACPRE